MIGEAVGAALEEVERHAEIELFAAGERAERFQRGGGAAADRQEPREDRRGAGVGRAGGERCLLEETVGDLADAAAADRPDAGEGQQVFDDAMRGGVIGPVERGEEALMRRRFFAAAAEPGDQRLQPRRVAEAPGQAASPRLGEVERVEHRAEQGRVADPHRGPGDAEQPRTPARARRSMSTSAAARSLRPSDSTPAWRNSPLPFGRRRKTGPR